MEFTEVGWDAFLGPHALSGAEWGTLSKPSCYNDGEDQCDTLSFIIDGVVYRAVENPGDGWRSSLDRVERGESLVVRNTFAPVAVVGTLRPRDEEEEEENDVLELYDAATGELILEVGTRNIGDWYPAFVGGFYPQAMSVNQGR